MSKLHQLNADTDLAITGVIPVGTIMAWPSGTGPTVGWLLCDGVARASATYPALSTHLGGAFDTAAGLAAPGAGNFRTPPLVKATGGATTGRIPIGILVGTDAHAGSGGAYGHGHGRGDLGLPAHTHSADGPTGRMYKNHGHNWSPSVNNHWHNTYNYTATQYGGKAAAGWVNGLSGGWTSTPISGGVSGTDAYIYGDSAGASGWSIGGSLTDPQDGPFVGVHWYIKH